jgi:hypothetical protein
MDIILYLFIILFSVTMSTSTRYGPSIELSGMRNGAWFLPVASDAMQMDPQTRQVEMGVAQRTKELLGERGRKGMNLWCQLNFHT